MFLKTQHTIAIILSSFFLLSPAHALNIASFIRDVADDITVIAKPGNCAANPYTNDIPCQPVTVTCPVGKSPVPIEKVTCVSFNKKQKASFQVDFSKKLSTDTTKATNFISCNPKSKPSYTMTTASNGYSYYNYIPEKVGYSPLCDPKTKTCNVFYYKVKARCVTTPDDTITKKLDVDTTNLK